MAKIRQEINILNATITATSVGFAVLNTSAYSGSVTYQFEIVGKVASGTCTVTCQRPNSTNDATVSLTETSYTRKRVTLTPPAGITRYRVGISGGTSPMIRAARILIFQDTSSEPLLYTETQIEIGNQETQTSTTIIPLTSPKYWHYDSSKWDSDVSFFAQVVGKRDFSLSSLSYWYLQEDDGAFGSWGTKGTIASDIASTTQNEYRIKFSPTSGRNYRIASNDNNTMNGGHVTYSAKIIAYREFFKPVGNTLAISTVGLPALAALSSSRVAFIDATNDSLRAYDFDGTNWAQVGNSLAISTVGNPALAALSSSRVAFIDDSNDSLRAYDFDGTNWAQVGNSLAISTVGLPALAALSSSRVAFIDATNDSLRAYDFDGTNWGLTGSGLTISGIGDFPAIASLSSSRVAFIDGTLELLTVYDFNGSNWSQVGNALSIPGLNGPSLCKISNNRVVLSDADLKALFVYEFDDTNWRLIGNRFFVDPSVSNNRMALMSSSRIAYVDNNVDRLRAFDIQIDSSTGKLEPQYLLINQNITATGLADFDTLFDPAEWSGVTNSYFHETNANGASSAVNLQTDPNGTPADISGSTATGENRQRTAALAMPSTSETIDANVTTA